MTDHEIVSCLLGILDFLAPCAPLPNAERLKQEFLRHGFERVMVGNDGSPEKFTVWGRLGTSGCRSADDLIVVVTRIALALYLPSLATESLYSTYPDGSFRVIVTLSRPVLWPSA